MTTNKIHVQIRRNKSWTLLPPYLKGQNQHGMDIRLSLCNWLILLGFRFIKYIAKVLDPGKRSRANMNLQMYAERLTVHVTSN